MIAAPPLPVSTPVVGAIVRMATADAPTASFAPPLPAVAQDFARSLAVAASGAPDTAAPPTATPDMPAVAPAPSGVPASASDALASSDTPTTRADTDPAHDACQAAALGVIAMIFPSPDIAPPAPSPMVPQVPARANDLPATPALPEATTAGHRSMESAAPRSSPASAPAASADVASAPASAATAPLADTIAVAAMPASGPTPPSPATAAMASSTTTAVPGGTTLPDDDGNAARLVEVLGQRLQFRTIDGTHRAVVRLEPYMAGTVRIEIRHEAGALQVHLSASNDEVVRQLQAVGDGLRQELSTRQYTEVSVHVGAQRHDGTASQGQPQERRDDGRAAADPTTPGRALAADTGLTVHFATALERLALAGTRDP